MSVVTRYIEFNCYSGLFTRIDRGSHRASRALLGARVTLG